MIHFIYLSLKDILEKEVVSRSRMWRNEQMLIGKADSNPLVSVLFWKKKGLSGWFGEIKNAKAIYCLEKHYLFDFLSNCLSFL